MENEVLNENVIDAAEEIVAEKSGKGLKTAGIIGLGVIGAGLLYKFAVKPIVAKVKSKKDKSEVKVARQSDDDTEFDDLDD